MLVGQKVPYEASYQPSAPERDTWSKIQGEHKAVGTSGLAIRDSLAAIRKPDWKWNPQFYKDALKAHIARIGL
jgi:hypothetical protein